MERLHGILNDVRRKHESNGYSKDESIAIIRESSRSFAAAALRFGYGSEHVNQVIAAHDADIAAIESGNIISIVKYTHQGAYIRNEELP